MIIDCKIGKLSYADEEQIDSYVCMFDALQKREDDGPTIEPILCSEKDEVMAKCLALADGKQMFTSKHLLQLPSTDDLGRQIESGRRVLEQRDRQG